MGQDLFKFLPSEMRINILSRLPLNTTMMCKCVCKPWLDLLESPDFANFHIAKSVPCLAVESRSMSCATLEFVDEHRSGSSYASVFNFKLPSAKLMHSSVNGLFLLGGSRYDHGGNGSGLILCNPVTRDLIKLPCPQNPLEHWIVAGTYGFGVSRMTGQYKVVKIFTDPGAECSEFVGQVYTVGTGSWRKIPRGGHQLRFFEDKQGVYLNGNLHWSVSELETNSNSERIACLDLETEAVGTFSPPRDVNERTTWRTLSVLRDSLCVCDNSCGENGSGYQIDIWLMKRYGDEKSWTKKFVFPGIHMDNFEPVWPIKVFENGVILMEYGRGKLLRYSNETKTIKPGIVCVENWGSFSCVAVYAPSFVSLKRHAMEDVSVF